MYAHAQKMFSLERERDSNCSLVPRLFPPPVYLIAYSMQIRRGKAWEIWTCAVTSGRQKVDTRGAVPKEESLKPFLVLSVLGLEARELARQSQYHPSFIARLGQFHLKWKLLLPGTAPRVSTICLPDVTAHDQISQAFPLRICIL